MACFTAERMLPQIPVKIRRSAPVGYFCECDRDFECFYEKVIKVKADVAALLNLFSDVSIDCTIKLGTKPNAVQLSFVP